MKNSSLPTIGLHTANRAFARGLVLLATFFIGTFHGDAAEPEVSRETVPKLFQKYCFDCHSGETHSGEIALDELLKPKPSLEQTAQWRRAWKIIRHEFMPPAGNTMPTIAERQAMEYWIAREMLGVDFAKPDPGRVTIRRLNRMEYEYSVQDLLGASLSSEQEFSTDVAVAGNALLRLRDRLPPDETAFGFDNIGDFLTLPPSLLERYFEIAEIVVQDVVVLDGPRSPERQLPATNLKINKEEARKRTEHATKFEVPHAGKYRFDFQFTIGGWQEYGGDFDFTANIDSTEVARKRLDVGGYKTHKFSASLELAAGKHTFVLVTDAVKPDAKGDLKYLELRPQIKMVGPLAPEFAAYPESHRLIFFNGEAPREPAARRKYARQILERIASRAFHRPVDAETLDGLVALAERSKQFESGIAQALTAILTSPKFLFRAESQPQPNDPTAVHLLDEYALASRLSYLLWLSLPDEELLKLAARGELRSNLHLQVTRMLADRKSERFFEDFPGQWLRTRNVLMTPISKSAGRLDAVRGSMKKETEMLFEHIARNDRDLIELITADYTFLDKKLADFYGIAGVPETGVHRVALLPNSNRSGILTHGSFLVSTSNPNRTSPVKRGLFILENLLGVEAPPPPPSVPALDDVNLGDTSKKTGRELLALHRAGKSCAACHAHFDPLGIALENYDLIGKWRTEENGTPIDSREVALNGEKIAGIADVQKLLLMRQDKFYRGITEKLLTYALGRGLEPADTVTVDKISRQLESNKGKFSTLLTGVIESPTFQRRRGDDGGMKASIRSAVPQIPPLEKRRPPKKIEPVVPEAVDNSTPLNPLPTKSK